MARPKSLSSIVEHLGRHPRIGSEVVHRAFLPAQEPSFEERELPEPLRRALAAAGVERLWSHQSQALDALGRGEDVLVTTPTASGKSLVFQLPVLEEALAGGAGRALFLFPLKALGQDQKAKLDALAAAAGLAEAATCEIYDGDTPPSRRAEIRRSPPRVLITNPDMLHLGLVPHAGSWRPFLHDLRWLVIDELHTYRGIFGSHFHHVMQRFGRLCRTAGAAPRIIASSATAENADEFASALLDRHPVWIQETGAPREGRHLILLRPEASPYTTVLHLFAALLEAGLKTIVFTKARRITELLYSWLRRQEPELARRVASYRSGFLPGERRKIERRMFDGELDGVISTSALEMGIDVGGLDACILVGYPGSMMATWQRSGRVGRSGRESITALVALPDALDQYFLDHPDHFLERPCERLIVDPDNAPVSRAHLLCAAAEEPLSTSRDRDYLERHAPLVGDLLLASRLLEDEGGEELHATARRPQRDVHLRGTGSTYPILETKSGRVVGTIDGGRAMHECHPGAVYLHGGRQFLVEELDLDDHKVHARRARLSYFTTPLTEKETEILEVLDQRRDGPLQSWLGRLKVTERVVGFEKKRLQGQEVIGQHPVELPPTHFETVGLWWAAPKPIERALRAAGEHFLGALHAGEHAAISLFPLLALCDRNDIGGISYPYHPQVGCGAVFVYDGHPGGVGLAQRGFAELGPLLDRVEDLVAACPCESGCPSCIQSPKCGNGNRPLHKAGAVRVLRLLRGRESLGEEVAELAIQDPPEEPSRRGRPSRRATRLPPLEPSLVDGGALPEMPPEVAAEMAAEALAEELAGSASPAGRSARAEASGPGGDSHQAAPEESPAPRERAREPSTAAAARRKVRRKRRKRPGVPRLPGRPEATVLFDLETLRSAAEVGGWGNSHRMGVAVGVVCHLEEGRFEVFREEGVGELIAALESADLVVGFNVKRFDYRVLNGYTGVDYTRRLPTRDLCDDIYRLLGRRIGLQHLVSETLGLSKSADGLQSLEWVREGRMDLVEDYCRQDVAVMRDLYLYGRREGHVCYRDRKTDRKLKVPVEW